MKKSIRTVILALTVMLFSLTTAWADETTEPLASEAAAESVIVSEEISIEVTTPEESTNPPKQTYLPETTTQQPTTQKATEPATTVDTKVTAWGKTSSGQFVNGNKQVIDGATMKGIDVSKWNGTINWKKVAASDVDFAIIRCGYGDNIKNQDDAYWTTNVAGCEKYNIPYGVYIYSYATTTAQAKSEAAHVLRLIKGHTLNFPIYYDMEDACQERLSNSKREKIANAFLKAIKAEGYECDIYANLNWWTNYLSVSLAEKSSWKWVAQYNNTGCSYTGNYMMWQCTATGTVSGISGYVDLNFWFGPVRTRLYNIQTTTTTIAAPNPVTPPARVTVKSLTAGKKKAKIKWKAVSGAKGYQIQYSTTKSFLSKYTKSVKTKATKITVKGLQKKTKYYFRIRAYKKNAAKQKVYSKKWSKVKKIKTKK